MGKCEIFKGFRAFAPDLAGGLPAPSRPPAGEGPSCARLVLLCKTYHLPSFHILCTSAGPVSFSLLRPWNIVSEGLWWRKSMGERKMVDRYIDRERERKESVEIERGREKKHKGFGNIGSMHRKAKHGNSQKPICEAEGREPKKKVGAEMVKNGWSGQWLKQTIVFMHFLIRDTEKKRASVIMKIISQHSRWHCGGSLLHRPLARQSADDRPTRT